MKEQSFPKRNALEAPNGLDATLCEPPREAPQAEQALQPEQMNLENGVHFVLQEAHHRIKNSLQIVSSILHLQAAHSDNPEVTRALRDAGTRVLAIAGVHETLNLSGSCRMVALAPFLTTLCRDIGQALGRQNITLDITAANVPADAAVPLALILNELLTNAIKYGKAPYTVRLRLEGGQIALCIGDAGDGPTGDGVCEGLGTRIIESCLRQLDGRMDTLRGLRSYTVTLTIPLRA